MFSTITLLAGLLAAAPSHAANDFPTRAVTFVVPVQAGGVTDKTARLVARVLQARWGQPVIVENKPGASSNLGAAAVAKAAPDGYTLLVSGGPFSINPSLFPSLPFDTQKAFTPVAQVTSSANVLLVNPSFPAKTLDEFLALARRSDNPLAYATAGNGSAQHLAMELLRDKAKLALNHVAYKGGAPAMTDLLGGHVQVMMSGIGDAAQFLQSNRVRALATTGRTRLASLPNVPTLEERGLLGFDTSGWAGIHAPAGTPPEVVTKINADVQVALADPAVLQGLTAMELQARPGTVADFRKFVDEQILKWKEAVTISGAKPD